MIKLTQEQIDKKLEGHKHWLKRDCEGWENMKADFSYCDLSDADLSGTNLIFANFQGANLKYVNLSDTNLWRANLSDVYLNDANLSHTNLDDADLSKADLSHTNLSNAKNVPYIPMVCPEEGDFIGWKTAGNKIVKLHIPQDALRSSATTRKCRCNKAEVVEIYNHDGTIAEERSVESDREKDFVYTVGSIVEVKDFDTNRWEECTRGIHFFINRQEAINYKE